MFSRIRETVRVLTYREPVNDACFVFTESDEPHVSKVGKRIASFVVGFVMISVVARIVGPIAEEVRHLIPTKTFVMTTLAGGIGALLMWMIDWVRNDILQSIRKHTNLEEKLAPFFGHKMESAYRVLKGSTRAS